MTSSTHPRKVLVCTQNLLRGGLETRLAGELHCLVERGVQVVVICGGVADPGTVRCLPAVQIMDGFGFQTGASAKELAEDVRALQRAIRTNAISHVYVHPFGSILPGVVAAELEGTPRTLVLHGPGSVNVGTHYGSLYDVILRTTVFPYVEEVVTVSEEIAAMLADASIGPVRGVSVVPNGVECRRFDHPERIGGERAILVLSRLDADRAGCISRLIREVKPYDDWRVVLAGDGGRRQHLEEEVAALGMQGRVQFQGFVYEPWALLSSFRYAAANGRAFLEAAVSGCRCILLGNEAPLCLIGNRDMPQLARSNFSGRGFERTPADDHELVPFLELRGDDPEYELKNWVRTYRNQPDLFAIWGFPEHPFKRIPGLVDVYSAIIDGQGNDPGPFVAHPRVWRRLYELFGMAAPESLVVARYIEYLEGRTKQFNELLWRTKEQLRRLQEQGVAGNGQ